ncbi:MAG: D-aminoacyl-tRNA deacylase [Verrucomicrobiota bacterium JB022]|nr:D-aminoacyl-tRNA deacylase [Verrucomicrobiota bacterium JB022]
MRAVVQRVHSASVAVDGQTKAAIGRGLLVFLGVCAEDTAEEIPWLAHKLPHLRIFEDEEGRMNRSLLDIGGEILLISQFTLYGNLKKGTRPSFNRAAPGAQARDLYEQFHHALEVELGQPIGTGEFGAEMRIPADNDGPVTLIIDTKQRDL